MERIMSNIENRNRDLVEAVKKKYGPVIDLEANPEILIEILQRFAADDPDGGTLPGGVPPSPPPDPCAVFGLGPGIDDLMREVLQVRRDLADLAARISRTSVR
jgi:hypothetical protein